MEKNRNLKVKIQITIKEIPTPKYKFLYFNHIISNDGQLCVDQNCAHAHQHTMYYYYVVGIRYRYR